MSCVFCFVFVIVVGRCVVVWLGWRVVFWIDVRFIKFKSALCSALSMSLTVVDSCIMNVFLFLTWCLGVSLVSLDSQSPLLVGDDCSGLGCAEISLFRPLSCAVVIRFLLFAVGESFASSPVSFVVLKKVLVVLTVSGSLCAFIFRSWRGLSVRISKFKFEFEFFSATGCVVTVLD